MESRVIQIAKADSVINGVLTSLKIQAASLDNYGATLILNKFTAETALIFF